MSVRVLWGVFSLCLLFPLHLFAAPPGFAYDPELDPEPNASRQRSPSEDVTIRKKKKKQPLFRGSYELGGGYDPGVGFALESAVRGRDLFRIDGLHLDVEMRWNALQFGALTTLAYDPSHSPWFGRLQLSYRTDRFGLRDEGDLTNASMGGFAEVGLKWGGGWRASLRYRLRHTELSNGHLLAHSSLHLPIDAWSGPRLQSALQLRLSYQSAQPRDPDSGMRVGARFLALLEGSHPAIGADFSYLRGEMKASYATMLPGGLHLSMGVDAGILVGQASDIPFAMRYRLGGLYGRSYWLPDIGPRIALGDRRISLGGQGMARAHTELRIPIVKQIGLYLFGALEAGGIIHNVASQPGAPGELALQAAWSAAGIVGLLWRSPIGPMRFGVSIPFVRQHPSDPPVLFGFSLGG